MESSISKPSTSTPSVHDFREMYSFFTYHRFSYKKDGNDLLVSFDFSLSSHATHTQAPTAHIANTQKHTNTTPHTIQLKPEVRFCNLADAFLSLTTTEQELLLFLLGMSEIPSYWKTTCSPIIQLCAPPAVYTLLQPMGTEFLRWWYKLHIFGLSEFYFVNKITEWQSSAFITWNLIQAEPNTVANDLQNEQQSAPSISPKTDTLCYVGESLSTLFETTQHMIPETDLLKTTNGLSPEKKSYSNTDENIHTNETSTIGNSGNVEKKSNRAKTGQILLPVGGGKDSFVTLHFFTELGEQPTALLLNPTPAAKAVVKSLELPAITIERSLDPTLLKMNAQGFLNGHTPFSAYLACVSQIVAQATGHTEIALANEQSANESNTTYHGLPINHQYSKSYEFEKNWQWLLQNIYSMMHFHQKHTNQPNTTQPAWYYSLLRPLHEIQIAQACASVMVHNKHDKQSNLPAPFISCNKEGRQNSWCHTCSKCLFAYTVLFPALYERVGDASASFSELFSENMFDNSQLIPVMQDLIGAGTYKPLECVGTYQETLLSAWKSIALLKKSKPNAPLPRVLAWVEEYITDVLQTELANQWIDHIQDWNHNHALPKKREKQLQDWLTQTQKPTTILLAGLGREAKSSFTFLMQQIRANSDNALAQNTILDQEDSWQTTTQQKNTHRLQPPIQIWLADELPLEKLDTFWHTYLSVNSDNNADIQNPDTQKSDALRSSDGLSSNGFKSDDLSSDFLNHIKIQFACLSDETELAKLQTIQFDTVIRSPGISLRSLQHTYAIQTETITSNTQLFFEQCVNKPSITVIGVTGTKGKSTTAAMIHTVLKAFETEQNIHVLLGGNIGTPPLDLLKEIEDRIDRGDVEIINDDGERRLNKERMQNLDQKREQTYKQNKIILVLELSCHQLADLTISPNIAVIQKITPEHLDYYANFDEYVQAKSSIARYQNSTDVVFFYDDNYNDNYDNNFAQDTDISNKRGGSNAEKFLNETDHQFQVDSQLRLNDRSQLSNQPQIRLARLGKGQKKAFGLQSLKQLGVSFDSPKTALKIPGNHVLVNVLPALLIAKWFGFDVGRAAEAARQFPGLPHRLEYITSKNGVAFYNDSLATTPESAAAAIQSFSTGTVHLIAGGHDRNLSFEQLAQVIIEKEVVSIALFPPVGARIEKALTQINLAGTGTRIPILYHVHSMQEALQCIQTHTKPGDTVLLSPAAPSFGIFKDYADRGNQFSAAVSQSEI